MGTDIRDWAEVSNMSSVGEYVFDNAALQTPSRFSALATIFDPGTIHHLEEIGVGEGWHCLEVGAGGGSIAHWLSGQVGATGYVLATDIDTRFLERLASQNLEVRRHDIVTDPLQERAFNLVHARLVLLHLPDRENVLTRLVAALKPGGWLLTEEFDSLSMRSDEAVNPAEPVFKTYVALQSVMTQRGADLRFGRLLAGRLRALGMAEVAAEGRLFMWQGGSLGADLFRANIEQLQDVLLETALISEVELEHDLKQLSDDHFMFPSPVMWSVRARRPLGR